LSCEPVILPTGPETNYQLPIDSVVAVLDQGVSGLLLASPANPTGSMIEQSTLREIAELCRERNVWLISDEIYHGITYGKAGHTAAAFSDDAIVINSFSKYFSMTGWRIGWMVAPENLLRAIERLNQNLYISTHAVSQLAALAAFDCRVELDANVAVYARNRKLLLKELPKAGITKIAPADGAFYLYADVSHLTDDAEAFCLRMLDETGVATTPGVDFDTKKGAQRVRFSYARAHTDITEGARRLKEWLAKG
jgi:aspartate/methionine/tyrosine aminotransferase